MSWSTKPPTSHGQKYWRSDARGQWRVLVLSRCGNKLLVNEKPFTTADEWGGLWWDAPVPEPGESFTVEQTKDYLERYRLSGIYVFSSKAFSKIDDPNIGIAATTERNKKEKRT